MERFRSIASKVLNPVQQLWTKTTLEQQEWISSIRSRTRTTFTDEYPIPESIQKQLVEFLEIRSGKQLKTLHEKILVQRNDWKVPDMRDEPLGWKLSRTEQVTPRVYGPSETLSYTAYQVNSSYSIIRRVLHDITELKPDFKPTSILDFGAGPGTGCWAAQEVFGDSLKEYRVVEPSQSMRDVAITTLEKFPGVSIRKGLQEMKHELKYKQTYDVVLAANVFSELPTEMERAASLSALWTLVAKDGLLVLVDAGSPWGSFNMRSARKLILDSNRPENDMQATVVAPCTHDLKVCR